MPLIINMWFKEKTGTALGICVSCGNAFGIIFNLLSAQVIVNWGWRTAYHVLPLIPLVLALPLSLHILKALRKLDAFLMELRMLLQPLLSRQLVVRAGA